ncbi:lycopene cyclase domain-containing protein [Stygiolobus caldivivus]|uniref:Lycopene cyclase domain-containing protein n=1 Tax=Stygiolobus caldivivus TaxID=2824673 RepID=A0A8D5ZEF8_9CREN|nr:lycopene cyclase domain-containing protein [Stygiolobus caldivivus]BCU69643.1 hypothetical protein KN1_09400 [Stygiolobus caldivivus]
MEIFLKHLAYQEIDLMILLPGIVFTIIPWTRRLRNYRAILPAIGLTALLFLIWDFIAVKVGTWNFNPEYVLPFRVIDLPVEEVEFFFVVPFSSLVFYEVYDVKVKAKLHIKKEVFTALGSIILASSLLFISHSYTFVVLIYLGASFIISSFIDPEMLNSLSFWLFVLTTYAPFLVFDYFLTSLPIVIYGKGATVGVSVTTIPVEDFLYSLSMFIYYALFYRLFTRSVVRSGR